MVRKTLASAVALLAPFGSQLALAQASLGSYSIEPNSVTVAGISSGGFMAVQLQIAYSSRFHGAAIFAGGPYYCAQDDDYTALGACSSGTGISVPSLVAYTDAQADAGTIDPTSFIAGKPIYLFSGTQDVTVHQAVMNALDQYYLTYTTSGAITYDDATAAGHGWISLDGPNPCGATASPFVNNCGADTEQTILGLFYGSLSPRNNGTLTGSLVRFDQNPFCGGDCSSISMDGTAWVFVPASCAGGARCRLVVALHGCLQDQGDVGEAFVQKSGLNEWADTNGIVVLYPQTVATSGNPLACWDWWGYSAAGYALKSAPQMRAIIAMIDQLSSGASSPDAGTEAPPPRGCGCNASDEVPLILLATLSAFTLARRRRAPVSFEPGRHP
jgi:poly(3-hydroxybutyrate) depolymerase